MADLAPFGIVMRGGVRVGEGDCELGWVVGRMVGLLVERIEFDVWGVLQLVGRDGIPELSVGVFPGDL